MLPPHTTAKCQLGFYLPHNGPSHAPDFSLIFSYAPPLLLANSRPSSSYHPKVVLLLFSCFPPPPPNPPPGAPPLSRCQAGGGEGEGGEAARLLGTPLGEGGGGDCISPCHWFGDGMHFKPST